MEEHPPRQLTMYQHRCPECGKEYVSHKKRQVCCSKECAGRLSCRMHGGTPHERKATIPKAVQKMRTIEEKVAAAQATWGSAAFDAQDQDSMVYGNMLYL